MAETVYKDIPDLPAATVPLAGTELIEVSATGATGKAAWANIFGSGWWAWLKAAFTSFKAPDSTHADDADTVGGETAAQLHAASALTGAIPLANIPENLTGKYALANGGNADTVDTYHVAPATNGIQVQRGRLLINGQVSELYAILDPILQSIGSWIVVSGGLLNTTSGVRCFPAYAERTGASQITLYCGSDAPAAVITLLLNNSTPLIKGIITY